MSSSLFQLTEYTSPCQHVREYPQATRNGERDDLKLAVKKYLPLNQSEPTDGDITIIAAHANGFPKEVYEPLWDDMLQQSTDHGYRIRAIWAADMSHQGASGVLNEDALGDDRAAQLVKLSTMHPRLFTSLILIEPMIQKEVPPGPNAAMLSTFRPDFYNSMEAGQTSIRRNKFFASWDSRALDRYIKHALRPVPTALYPISEKIPPGSVTLTTTKHQEAWTYVRSNFEARIGSNDATVGRERRERLLSPDLNSESEGTYVFHRAEPGIVEASLPTVRPSVLYMFGGKSPLSPPEKRKSKLENTGVGTGGSGGHECSMVSAKLFPDGSHLLPCERPKECAEAAAAWLGFQTRRSQAEAQFLANHPSGKSEKGMRVVSKQWQHGVRQPATVKRPIQEKL
ncbi:MAG: hypothetical protein Q9216_004379 [Gyalolechia sp. 2 TL-2023]